MITSDDVFNLARSLKGQHVSTIGRRSTFTVEVEGDNLHFTPATTKRRRSTPRGTLDKVVAIYNKTGSLSCPVYHDTTYNGSYILGLISKL